MTLWAQLLFRFVYRTCPGRDQDDIRDALATDKLDIATGAKDAARFVEGLPERACEKPQFFMEPVDFFADVYEAVEQLKKHSEVIIAGWMFNFKECFLKGRAHEDSRADRWIKRAVDRGVNVHVQFWYNQNNIHKASLFAEFKVEEQAKMLRELGAHAHPFIDSGRGSSMSALWSWHIKTTVIDRKVAYVGGIDYAPERWDTPQHLRPDPRREPNGRSWIDAHMKVDGEAARDVANALVARHVSYCNAAANAAHRGALRTGIFGITYDPCDEQHMPRINTKEKHIVGGCKFWNVCKQKYTTCWNGECVCQDGTSSKEGETCAEETPATHGASPKNKCRVLFTASNYRLDVSGDKPEIHDAYIAAIKKAEHYILIANQYVVGEREGGDCRPTCPKNKVTLALSQKLEEKINQNERFSVVVFLAGKTSDTHMPVLKTLFGEKDIGAGLKTRLKAFLKEKGKSEDAWKEYLAIAHACNAMTPEYLKEQLRSSGVTVKPDLLEQPEAPGPGHASFYGMLIHSKVLIVDGNVAQVGSANINDRSLLGSMNSDAELNVEIRGPAAQTLFDMTIAQYTGYPRDINQDPLALTVNEVADQNNKKLADWFGIDFVKGVDKPPSEQSEHPLDTNEIKNSPYIAAMSGGHPMMREVAGPRPDFEGFIFPWTEKMWAPPTAQKWLDQVHWAVRSTGMMKAID